MYDEIVSGIAQNPQLRDIESFIRESHFMLRHLAAKEHEYFLALIPFLGKGEASCLAFAKVNKATVVTDDKTARRQCAQMGLSVSQSGTVLKISLVFGSVARGEAGPESDIDFLVYPDEGHSLLDLGGLC